MKNFDYNKNVNELLKPEIITLLTNIHEYRGKQELYFETDLDLLNGLIEITKIQSVNSSNSIEGIHTTDKRLESLMKEKTTPINRDEEEIIGYRDILAVIHEEYNYIQLKPNMILQFHKMLYKYTNGVTSGQYKNSDNSIIEIDSKSNKSIRFQPISAHLTSKAMDELCFEFNLSLQNNKYDPLLLIPMFILDFLCIHPFNDGNGRTSRLLTLMLLYQAGYQVGKYVSIEKIIEKTKESYYDSLKKSSEGWLENKNDYLPFVKYYLGIIQDAYIDFSSKMQYIAVSQVGLSKTDRLKKIIADKVGRFSKRDLVEENPDISVITIERTLAELVKGNVLEKVGKGKSTMYVTKSDKLLKKKE